MEKKYKFKIENPEERSAFWRLDTNWMIILKCMLKAEGLGCRLDSS